MEDQIEVTFFKKQIGFRELLRSFSSDRTQKERLFSFRLDMVPGWYLGLDMVTRGNMESRYV